MADDQDQASGQDDVQVHVLHLDVRGMHCVNCAVLIERRLKELPQVHRVSIGYPAGDAVIRHSGELDIATVQTAIGDGWLHRVPSR